MRDHGDQPAEMLAEQFQRQRRRAITAPRRCDDRFGRDVVSGQGPVEAADASAGDEFVSDDLAPQFFDPELLKAAEAGIAAVAANDPALGIADTDAGADGNHRKGGAVATAPELQLGFGGGMNVIVGLDRKAEPSAEPVADGEIDAPAQQRTVGCPTLMH